MKTLSKTDKKTKLIPLNGELRIIISPVCNNLNCFYCHGEGVPNTRIKTKKGTVVINKNIKLLPEIFDFSKRIREVTITGGEPTLFPSYIEKLINYFQRKTDNLTLITNGTNPQFLLKYAHYFTEIHLHVDVVDTDLRKKFMGKASLPESRIKKLAKELNKRTNLRINSIVEDKYPIESLLELLLWTENNNIKIGFIKPLLKESKNFEVLKKLIPLASYKKVRQRNIRKVIYKNSKGHIVEFILCRCDAYKSKDLSAREIAKECSNNVLNFNLSNGKLSFCFLGKEVEPQKFLSYTSKFRCPLKKKAGDIKYKDSVFREYEVRCPIQDIKKLSEEIRKQKSFVFQKRRRVCDFVYHSKKMSKFHKFKKGDAVIRLRITKFAREVKPKLNIKEKVSTKEWLEWTTFSIKRPLSLISILNKIYRPEMILDRIRTTYFDNKKGTKIEIDEFKDLLGNFVELEGKKDTVESLRFKLKLKKFLRAYGDIMNENIKKHRISFEAKDFIRRFTEITKN